MEEIAISTFKAKCLAILERVRRTKQPIRVTRFGKPIVEISPPKVERVGERQLGTLRDSLIFLGDIESPVSSEDDWDAARGEWEPKSLKKKK